MKQIFILSIFLMCITTTLCTQEISVSETISNESDSLVGVNLLVKGTKKELS